MGPGLGSLEIGAGLGLDLVESSLLEVPRDNKDESRLRLRSIAIVGLRWLGVVTGRGRVHRFGSRGSTLLSWFVPVE